METGLRLLMRDGAIQLHFRPKLTPEHYAELLRAAEEATTRAELRMVVRALAKSWGSEVKFDEP